MADNASTQPGSFSHGETEGHVKLRIVPSIFAAALLVSLISPAVAHDGEHHGKEENGWPGSAKGQEVARAFLADAQPAQELAVQSTSTCEGGAAAGYPCGNVDLQAFLPLADIGGGKGNDIWGWTDPDTRREYAIMGRTTGTSFVDITTPSSPVYVGNLPTTRFSSTWRDIKVYDNHAFVVSESRNHGMQVFDLTRLRGVASPVTFSADANYSGFATAHNIFINEQSGFAYAVGTNTCSGGLHMIDIRVPTGPVNAGCYSGDGYSHDVQCVVYAGPDATRHGRELCFASNEDTLTVVDVTNKGAPVQLARVPYEGASYTHQGWLTDDQRYFLIDDELDEGKGFNTRTYVFDVANPAAPVHTGTYEGTNPAIDHNQYIVGNYSYQANYRSGLRILDISGVATPSLSEVGFFDIYPADDAAEFNGAWSVYPFFASGNVVVSGIEQGLYVLRPNLGPSDARPSVTLTDPADGATVAGTAVNVSATASDDVGVEQVTLAVDGASIGPVSNSGVTWSTTWDSTTVADGAHTLTATATDTADQQSSHSISVTVDNVPDEPAATMHVADLSGLSTGGGKSWTATVTITVVDSQGDPVPEATVTGAWSAGTLASGSCDTNSSGQCSIPSGSIPKRTASVTFEVTEMTHDALVYDPESNVESSITMAKP